jgi:hypothetical protein
MAAGFPAGTSYDGHCRLNIDPAYQRLVLAGPGWQIRDGPWIQQNFRKAQASKPLRVAGEKTMNTAPGTEVNQGHEQSRDGQLRLPEAFTMTADELKSLDLPDQASFYTSGKTTNEPAFLLPCHASHEE